VRILAGCSSSASTDHQELIRGPRPSGVPRPRPEAQRRRVVRRSAQGAGDQRRWFARRGLASRCRQARSSVGKWPVGRWSTLVRRASCSTPGTRQPEPPLRSERLAAHVRGHRAARAAGRPLRGPPQSVESGASSAICSRMTRISVRSASSAASRSTSSAIDERVRRLAAASLRAVRTASESLVPLPRTTLSAAAELSSNRT
jgi:hypothetical protein